MDSIKKGKFSMDMEGTSSPQRQSQIREQLNNLGDVVARLEKIKKELVEKLEPILRPISNPKILESSEKTDAPIVFLAMEIKNQILLLNQLEDGFNNIINAIEL